VRVAIYARVSTKDKGQDTANQLIQLRESTGRRVRTRRAAPSSTHVQGREPGKFDLVLFWALDRFTREGALETLQYLQRLTAAGVNWRSYTEAYLDSCGVFKDAVLAILAVIAKQGAHSTVGKDDCRPGAGAERRPGRRKKGASLPLVIEKA
jgi:DNA invertase Pin-like site-specific DNA recombinase